MHLLELTDQNNKTPVQFGAALRHNFLGATPDDSGGTNFLVWAPFAETCRVHIIEPWERVLEATPLGDGYYGAYAEDCGPGALYFYELNGAVRRPDPASRSQPHGINGPSRVVRLEPEEDSKWPGINLSDYIIYEIHIGTFTPEGTFDSAILSLDRLKQLGVTAIEVMPVAAFPGDRNWGYDGVYPFAVQHSYGEVEGLKRLVRACHDRGLAFILDVVYNHLGPEGNYFHDFGPYFTDCHKTLWGDALNYYGPQSDHVRRYFIENALYWIDQCGVDALRLDAVHAIHDESAYPFLRELSDCVRTRSRDLGRPLYLIAESDLNDARLLRPAEQGGMGLDAQWTDDFHHCLHTLLTGELRGYYRDFGRVDQLAKALHEGWVYSGQYSVVRQRRFGNSPAHLEPYRLVVYSQSHDHAGNRLHGERLLHLSGWDGARLAAAAVILSPYIPMLFMGEEYGEPAPFLYHVSHSDPELLEAVRRGRMRELAEFAEASEMPDPKDEETFRRSKLNQHLAESGQHARLHAWYQCLIEFRRTHPALQISDQRNTVAIPLAGESALLVRRIANSSQVLILLHFGTVTRALKAYLPKGDWRKVLDSSDTEWGGPGSSIPVALSSTGDLVSLDMAPRTCVVFLNESA